MRLKIVRAPTHTDVDGIRLDGFLPGRAYEVGTTLATLFLSEGWAIPADPSEASLPATVAELEAQAIEPVNVVREAYPPSYEGRFAIAADYSGRRRQQRKKKPPARRKVQRKRPG